MMILHHITRAPTVREIYAMKNEQEKKCRRRKEVKMFEQFKKEFT